MISATLTTLEQELRRAAGRRAYADVEQLVVSVGAAAAGEARSFPPGDPQVREIAIWLNQLYEWTGVMLRAARAAHAEELRRMPFLKTYLRHQSLSNL
jgi:hypothetical protein